MSEYKKQAEKFLKKHNIKFYFRFLKHDRHFHGDKEYRDIFSLALKAPGRKTAPFRFGQSLAESTGNGGNPPHPYDLLASITKYPPGNFQEFAREFGYEGDSLKAHNTYRAVVAEWNKVEAFFTAKELEEVRGIS